MRSDPYSVARSTRDADRVNRVLGRKSGGRVRDDGDTNIHIEVNAEPKEQEAMPDLPPMAGPPPPLPPGPPPMMPPPGPGGGLGGGGGPLAMRRGGRVGCGPDGKKMREGGAVNLGRRGKVDVGGAGGGTGRLEKAADARRRGRD